MSEDFLGEDFLHFVFLGLKRLSKIILAGSYVYDWHAGMITMRMIDFLI